jgi:hypothetical protein
MSGLEQYLAQERVQLDVSVSSAEDVLEALARLLGGNDAAQRE